MEDNKNQNSSYGAIPLEVGNVKDNIFTSLKYGYPRSGSLGSKIKEGIRVQKRLLLWKRPLFLFYSIVSFYIILLLLFFIVKYFLSVPSLVPVLFFNRVPQLISKYVLFFLIFADILFFLVSIFIYLKIYYRIKEIAYLVIILNLVFSVLLFLTFYKTMQMSL